MNVEQLPLLFRAIFLTSLTEMGKEKQTAGGVLHHTKLKATPMSFDFLEFICAEALLDEPSEFF